MMNAYKGIVILVLICVHGGLLGQRKSERSHYLGAYYGMSIPLSGNFMKHISPVMFSAEYTWHVLPWFTVGGYAGYSSGEEKGLTSDRYEGDLVNGYTERQVSLLRCGIPFYFSFPSEYNRLEPYIRVAGGVSNVTYKIKGDQINRSFVCQWSGVIDLGFGCRFFFNEEHQWGLDFCGTYRWNPSSWKLMNVQNNHCFELSLGILIKLSH